MSNYKYLKSKRWHPKSSDLIAILNTIGRGHFKAKPEWERLKTGPFQHESDLLSYETYTGNSMSYFGGDLGGEVIKIALPQNGYLNFGLGEIEWVGPEFSLSIRGDEVDECNRIFFIWVDLCRKRFGKEH